MSFRCVVCEYWIVDGKCACNSNVGYATGTVPSVMSETARWTRRGVLPMTSLMGTTCGCHCLGCLHGLHHPGSGTCTGP